MKSIIRAFNVRARHWESYFQEGMKFSPDPLGRMPPSRPAWKQHPSLSRRVEIIPQDISIGLFSTESQCLTVTCFSVGQSLKEVVPALLLRWRTEACWLHAIKHLHPLGLKHWGSELFKIMREIYDRAGPWSQDFWISFSIISSQNHKVFTEQPSFHSVVPANIHPGLSDPPFVPSHVNTPVLDHNTLSQILSCRKKRFSEEASASCSACFLRVKYSSKQSHFC